MYISGTSCICIGVWGSPAPYIHLYLGCFPYLLLPHHFGFGKNQGNIQNIALLSIYLSIFYIDLYLFYVSLNACLVTDEDMEGVGE